MRFVPQDKHQTMYAISVLKHVVVGLGKSEGRQKWLAPCGTDPDKMCTELLVLLISLSLRRILTGKTKS
jgi:hypothetical protein